jgi:hypothetical protein
MYSALTCHRQFHKLPLHPQLCLSYKISKTSQQQCQSQRILKTRWSAGVLCQGLFLPKQPGNLRAAAKDDTCTSQQTGDASFWGFVNGKTSALSKRRRLDARAAWKNGLKSCKTPRVPLGNER